MKIKVLSSNFSKNNKIFIIITLISLGLFLNLSFHHLNFTQIEIQFNGNKVPNISGEAFLYILNLTNPEINNTQYTHNQSITVKGFIYNFTEHGQKDVNVTVIFDGVDLGALSEFNATDQTDTFGNFEINTTIPMWANVYQPNLVNVSVTDPKSTKYNHHYIINVTADSKIEYDETNDSPVIRGENYKIAGNLSFDNNSGISGENVDVSWRIDGSDSYLGFITTDANGTFSGQFPLPLAEWSTLALVLNFPGTSRINDSFQVIESLLIYTPKNSTIEYQEINQFPKIRGEGYNIAGYLYSNNNSRIPEVEIDIFWRINGIDEYQGNITTDSNGYFSGIALLPSTEWISLALVINFTSSPKYEKSSLIIDNLFVFSNFTCNWYLPENITEGETIIIRGELSSFSDPSFKIFNRSINIYFGGVLTKQLTTNSSGGFSFEFIASGNGTLTVSTENLLNLPVQSSIVVNIAAGAEAPPPGGFLINPVTIIILIVIIAGIITAVYFFSKRQAAEPKVVQIPLENKLKNITILKNTDRREESVVYLFYVFLQLSEAKYGVIKQSNETINDYAIKCVRDMGLPPSKIYPFIKKIEQILYGSGGKISEEDFEEIFSQFITLFYDFTGYQITLK